ncbi:C40 family peptidase [Streptomyces sp. NPDC046876]|uniref:C40 family peptidase n=1 Tax=Streptomyces sp. NPDC046876 TaxID=3155616 RepID=UPI0033D8DC67
MPRRLLHAACIAAVLLAACPLSLTHAEPRPASSPEPEPEPEPEPTVTPDATPSAVPRVGATASAPSASPSASVRAPGRATPSASASTSASGPSGSVRASGLPSASASASAPAASVRASAPAAFPRATAPAAAGDEAEGAAGNAAPPAAAPGAGDYVGGLLTRLQGLYREAEEAAEAYDAAAAALKARQDDERRLSTELGRARAALGAERAAAGRLAREQYQSARGLSPYARMLLTGDLQAAQDQRRLAARESAHQAGVLTRLARGERRADALATAARKALDAQQDAAARTKKLKDRADLRLREVERMLSALTADQLARVGAREAEDTAAAQRDLLASGRLGAPGSAPARTPTAAGGAALAYATAQIGKPYVWGAEGPGAFDCSGLTSQAWAHAGRAIPRTSQEQWAQLPRVPLDDLRPGDLVVYFPTATHVGLYLGEGKVVHAPRPGSPVKVSPLAANPLLGAVRPDPDGTPLAAYSLPPLPEAAAGGGDDAGDDDAGYSAAEAPAP